MKSPLIQAHIPIMSPFKKGVRSAHTERETPDPVYWRVTVQGRHVLFSRHNVVIPHRDRMKKNPVGVWSVASRMNLLKMLNHVDSVKVNPAVFITLTYPDHVVRNEYAGRSRDRAVFWRYVEKHLGRHVPAFWRIEWEERKSGVYTGLLRPHFHLMAFGVKYLDKDLMRDMWRKAIGSRELDLSTSVKRIRGTDAVSRYVSKYVSKYRSLDISTYRNSGLKFGRHWGILRPSLVPYSPVVMDRDMTAKEIARVQRYAASRWNWYDPEFNGGFSLFGQKWADGLFKMLGGA